MSVIEAGGGGTERALVRAMAVPAERARLWRVSLLLTAAALMGLADLACTLQYMRSIGMMELNPIARSMVLIGGEQQLVLYKLFTISLTCGCLYLVRRHRRAELGAWACTVIMLALTMHWVRYNDLAPDFTRELTFISQSEDRHIFTEWVNLDD